MTIASEIQRIKNNIADAYTSCSDKGATMPQSQVSDNLADCIDSIQTGSTPVISSLNVTPTTSTQTITAPSGTDGYSPVNVSAVTSAIDSNITAGNIKKDVTILGVTGTYEEIGIPREINNNGVYRVSTSLTSFSLPSDATSISSAGLAYAFYNCRSLRSIDLSNIKYIETYGATYAFYLCANLGNVDLSNLIRVNSYGLQYAFHGCTSLTSISFPKLTTIFNGATYAFERTFESCTNLMSADFSALNNLDGLFHTFDNAFRNCTSLTSVDFSSVVNITKQSDFYGAFNGCTSLTDVDFSSLETVSALQVFYNAFKDCISLQNIDLSSLITVTNNNTFSYAFSGCTNLSSIDLSNLTTIGSSTSNDYAQFANCFQNCNSLTTLTFPKLEKIYCTGSNTASYGTFYNCNEIQKMYFPKLDTITYASGASTSNQNACKQIFANCSSLTELHFASANRSAIEATAGYSTAWGRGAGNVTIYFDL